MRKTARLAAAAATFAVLAGSIILIPSVASAADAATITKGKNVATNRKAGNCLACHAMGDGISPGDIGPPLVAMKSRFPDKAGLRAQIWDAQVKNPDTRMPPFGKHKIISESDIDAIVEYLYTL